MDVVPHAVPVSAALMVGEAIDFAVALPAAAFADHDVVAQPVDSSLVYSVAVVAEHVFVVVPADYPFVDFWVAVVDE